MGLTSVLALGLVLRLWGVRFGLPDALLHLDEPPIVLRAQQILDAGDGNPRWFHYPSLFIYLQVVLQALFRHSSPFLLARVTSVVTGVLTLWLTYAVGRRVYSRAVGLLAALFLTVSFLHARESHFGTVDSAATFWVMGCVLTSTLALQAHRHRARWLLVSAALAGLAAGTKYNTGLVVIAPLAVVLMGGSSRRRLVWGGTVLVLALATFALSTPFAILDSPTFVKDLRFEVEHYREGHFGFEGSFNAGYFARYLFAPGLGEGIAVFILLGLTAWGLARERAMWPVLAFAALYYVSVSCARVNFVRNLLPVLPVFCLLAGLGAGLVIGRLPSGKWIRPLSAAALVAGLVVLPLWRTVTYDRSIAESTRLDAGRWIAEHVPRGRTLAVELYGPEPVSRNHRVLMLLHLADEPIQWFSDEGVDFLVASAGAYEMAYRNRGRYPDVVARYDEIFRRFPLVHQIDGERIDPLYSSISPTIRILAGPGRAGPSGGRGD